MLTFAQIQGILKEVRRETGPFPVRLWSWKECSRLFPDSKGDFGRVFGGYSKMAVNPDQSYGSAINTVWHETGHILFPRRPHWWVECYAHRMSGYDYYGYRNGWRCGPWTKKANKYIECLVPGAFLGRRTLKIMSVKAALRLHLHPR